MRTFYTRLAFLLCTCILFNPARAAHTPQTETSPALSDLIASLDHLYNKSRVGEWITDSHEHERYEALGKFAEQLHADLKALNTDTKQNREGREKKREALYARACQYLETVNEYDYTHDTRSAHDESQESQESQENSNSPDNSNNLARDANGVPVMRRPVFHRHRASRAGHVSREWFNRRNRINTPNRESSKQPQHVTQIDAPSRPDITGRLSSKPGESFANRSREIENGIKDADEQRDNEYAHHANKETESQDSHDSGKQSSCTCENELVLLITELAEREKEQLTALARKRSNTQTKKRILFRSFVEFAYQCATKLRTYHNKYELDLPDNYSDTRLIPQHETGEHATLGSTLKKTVTQFPSTLKKRSKEMGLLMARIFFNKAVNQMVPNPSVSIPQEIAELLIPISIATLASTLLFPKKKGDADTIDSIGKTTWRLVWDSISRLLLVRCFLQNKKSPLYHMVNGAAILTPFITRKSGQDLIKAIRTEKKPWREVVTVPACSNIMFDWLEELLVYDMVGLAVEKTMPHLFPWLDPEKDPLFILENMTPEDKDNTASLSKSDSHTNASLTGSEKTDTLSPDALSAGVNETER